MNLSFRPINISLLRSSVRQHGLSLSLAIATTMSLTNLGISQEADANQNKPTANASGEPIDVSKLFEAREYTGQNGQSLKYRLLKPINYEEGKKYPLVLFLHGAGERGDDNTKQLVHGAKDFAEEGRRKEFPAFIVAPQCPTGKRWSEVDWSKDSSTLPESPSDAMALVKELLDEMIDNSQVDTNRIYITGLSMGGYGTWDAIARYPNFFAAAIPICGGGDPGTVERFKSTPIWCFHGDEDQAVKVTRSREMVDALKKINGDVKYTEYPGVGHNSWTVTYANPEIYTWLFSKKLNAEK